MSSVGLLYWIGMLPFVTMVVVVDRSVVLGRCRKRSARHGSQRVESRLRLRVIVMRVYMLMMRTRKGR